MKILFGMPSKDSVGGPVSSEPPFVDAIRALGVEVVKTDFVYGSRLERKTTTFERFTRVFRTALKIRKLLKKDEFDVVHLNTAFDKKTVLRDSFTLALVRRATHAKVFLKMHGTEPQQFLNAGFFWRRLIRFIDQRSDAIGVHTTKEVELLQKLGFHSSKFHLVKNVIPGAGEETKTIKEFRIPVRILFAGRFVKDKCVLESIKSVKVILERGHDVHLMCLGDGPEMKRAVELVKELDLEERVSLPGYVSEESVITALSESDIFIFPTRFGEGFPNIFFKALAKGLPVVTTRFRYADENFNDGEDCVFCDPDPESIAIGIDRILGSTDLRKRLYENGRAISASLSSGRVAKDYLELYEGLI